MGQSYPLHFRSFECRILDRSLKVVESIPFKSASNAEATEASAALFGQATGADLAGFEVWRDGTRLLVRLETKPDELTPTVWAPVASPQVN